MDTFKDIKAAFDKQLPDKVIIKVTNYDDENIYVIQAVPKDRAMEFGRWLDGMYSMNRDSLKVIGGFNPIMHNPKVFCNLPEENIIYFLGKERPIKDKW